MEARRLAVARLDDLPDDQALFVNVDPVLPKSTPPIIPPIHRIVLEIAETRSILDNPQLLDHITTWRSQGYRIAIDDYGAGYMGLGAALTVRPDIVKIDRSVTAGVLTDRVRQAAIKSTLYVFDAAEAMVIAEGVETPEEYWLLRQLGVRYMQGFLFGRPQADPRPGPIKLPSRLGRLPATLRVPHTESESADLP
jgi:EAL domain-containing protein (putative c-di-GMP-specific phosphodiesterase class I)